VVRHSRDCTRDGKHARQPYFPTSAKALLTVNTNSAREASESLPLPGNMMSERDCLNLSVYTPELGGCAPVMFWIHGGAFLAGSGSDGIYSSAWGSELARRQGIVLVTINSRYCSPPHHPLTLPPTTF
jgi:carboxylesterase type B